MEPDAPKNINKYEVIGLLGRGGMGAVYKAIDRSLNRLVAVKMVTNRDEEQGEAERGEALARFYREAQFTASLRHPNIVTVYELGEFKGRPYLVMEYLDGQSLSSMLAHQPMTTVQKLDYVRQVCMGLHYAHTRQPSIVHRDIKPANVVVVENETVKIVDFGIAQSDQSRFTHAGLLMGSYHYMSPEQINDLELDGRTDIFSTGVLLYQLLTLTLPFEASGITQTLHRIVHSPPPPLGQFLREYPPELDEIVANALAKQPAERYQTAAEFAADLLQVEEGLKLRLFGANVERAENFLRSGELEPARQELAEVLNADREHTRAKELMRQVQQAAARLQRKEHARDLRAMAQREVGQNRLEEALGSLEQAIKLDKTDTELQLYREQVVALHERAKKVDELLARHERACAAHDLDGAARAVQEALKLDPDSERAKAAQAIVEAKIAERHARLPAEISERLQADKSQSTATETEGASGPVPPGLSRAPHWQPAREPHPERTSTNPFGTVAKQKQDHSVAELTPVEGIAYPDVSTETVAGALPANAPPMATLPASQQDGTLAQADQNSSSAVPSAPDGRSQGVPLVSAQTSFTKEGRAWPDELLQQIERQLAAFIGPVAKIVVGKAACRTNDPEEFYKQIAESIERRVDRQTFLAHKIPMGPGQGASQVAPPTSIAVPEPSRIGLEPCGELTPAAIERAAHELARFTGPIAGVLAKKAAPQAESLRALYVLLSDNIDSDADRDQFLSEAGFLDA